VRECSIIAEIRWSLIVLANNAQLGGNSEVSTVLPKEHNTQDPSTKHGARQGEKGKNTIKTDGTTKKKKKQKNRGDERTNGRMNARGTNE